MHQHQKLKENLQHLDTRLLRNKPIHFNPDYPLIYPEIDRIYDFFATNKIIVTNFKYPTDARDLNRIVITANHKKEDLDKIIRILNQYQF